MPDVSGAQISEPRIATQLGLVVAERVISLDLVEKALGTFVTSSWAKYKPLFLDVRATAPDPYLGEYFQWLAELIEQRMRERPRKPFFETGAAAAKKLR